MANTIGDDLKATLFRELSVMERLLSVELALEQLGLLDVKGALVPSVFGSEPVPGAAVILTNTEDLETAVRSLVRAAGSVNKSFDAESNRLVVDGVVPTTDGPVKISLRIRPPDTCTVRRVEEKVEVPEQVIPARTETRVRYVLEGDCLPLLANADAETTRD